MEATKTMTMERFSGIDNVTPNTRLISERLPNGCPVWPLQQAVNVYIDDAFRISSRPGRDELYVGTDIHSLWSDGRNCFFVDLTTFRRLLSVSPFQSLPLGSVAAGERMSYASCNNVVYWTNGVEIGYVDGNTSSALADPGTQFKQPLPPGQLIEYFRGCKYVARGKTLYISDPLSDFYDVRTGYKQFADPITLLRAVDTGLYVGDSVIWWVKGEGNDELARIEAYGHPAIIHTDLRTNGQNFGEGKHGGNVAIWTGKNGICLGDNSGLVVNMTESRYALSQEYAEGTGFVRDKGNVRHYLNSLY